MTEDLLSPTTRIHPIRPAGSIRTVQKDEETMSAQANISSGAREGNEVETHAECVSVATMSPFPCGQMGNGGNRDVRSGEWV